MHHGQQYDAKHMMHTFRLLNMAEDIARYKKVIVFREDREFLLKIRSGQFRFETLMEMVEEKVSKVEEYFNKSDLPDKPDERLAEELLIEIRERFYKIAF